MKTFVTVLTAIALSCTPTNAPAAPSTVKASPVYVDAEGVMRWRSNKQELLLFGANYSPYSAGDFRLAKRVSPDVKAMIDADMAHFARMGWDGLRLSSWGDWETSDSVGNLIENEHSELMDYTIAQAEARGIKMLLSPIVTYSASFADRSRDPDYKAPGFSAVYGRPILGTDPKAIAAQTNYLRQVLNHVNPYTKTALKDDTSILFVEMINEPVHHPEDTSQSIDYINTLVDAVRSTGSQQITFHNFSQDFKIADALAQSRVQGIDFGWYPSGLVSGHTLEGNYLQSVEEFPDLMNPKLIKKPRIVYEFDQADLNTGYLFPAMARTYRGVGTQFAAIFSYDMLDTAPYNLSWQTHFINLVHTPRQAISAVIAGEAMRRLPRFKTYGAYPENTTFGDFKVNYETDSSEMNAVDAFMYAGDTTSAPRKLSALTRIVGFGSSPVVSYEGTGAYFLDKIRDGVWRLEVYPDEVIVSDPFAQPQPDKVVSRLYSRKWPMTISLPELGARYTALPLTVPSNTGATVQKADNAVVQVEPGVWLISRSDRIEVASLPETINRVGLREFHVNAQTTYPDLIQVVSPSEFVIGEASTVRVRLSSQAVPDQVSLFVRPVGSRNFTKPIPMRRLRGMEFGATLAPADFPEGHYEYVVADTEGMASTTFPDNVAGHPGVWPFEAQRVWSFTVTAATTPLEIFNPDRDVRDMTFVRPSEEDRTPMFKVVPGETSSARVLSLAIPALGANTPEVYAGTVFIGDQVSARGVTRKATSVKARVRATGGAHKTLDLFLVEKDGSSWRASVPATDQWQTLDIPLTALTFSKSILTPTPYPGLWSYWREGPAARAKGTVEVENLERLEMRVYRNEGDHKADDADGIEIASVQLGY